MHRFWGSCLALGLAACAPADGPAERSAERSAKGPADIQTELELIDRVMRVSYRSEPPVDALYFARVPDDFRAAQWVPGVPGVTIVHADGQDIVRRADGRPFTEAVFDVPIEFRVPPKDYAAFMPDSQGGVLIHSGRFQVCAEPCEGGETHPMAISGAETLILNGQVSSGRAAWTDGGDGLKLYAGPIAPVRTSYVTAVIDPGLPSIIRAELDDLFPQLMAHFARRLRTPSPKPTLFATLDRDAAPDGNPDSNRFSAKDGTLPGQVFMHLAGDGWLESEAIVSDHAAGLLPWFFAHEAAHLHQGEVTDIADVDYWIHEGGADALGALALRDIGADLPEGYIDKRLSEAAASCADGARGGLNAISMPENLDLHYACGLVIQMAAHVETGDLHGLWRDYMRVVEDGAPWSAETFLSAMENKGALDAAELAREIIAGPAPTADRLRAAITP